MAMFLMVGLLGGWGAVIYGIFRIYRAAHQKRKAKRIAAEVLPSPAPIIAPEFTAQTDEIKADLGRVEMSDAKTETELKEENAACSKK